MYIQLELGSSMGWVGATWPHLLWACQAKNAKYRILFTSEAKNRLKLDMHTKLTLRVTGAGFHLNTTLPIYVYD